jgi:Ca2+-binding RTX toxin-like protein
MAYLDNGLGQSVLVGTVDADTLDSTQSGSFVLLVGGAGSDTYIVDDFNFSVFEISTDPGTDTIRTFVSFGFLPGNIENLVLEEGAGAANAPGNELNNVITGNSSNNILNGGLGADTMNGGLGADTYFVDNVGDKVNEAAGAGFDTVNSSTTFTLAVNVEGLNLTGTAAINGTGNASDNTLIGNSGANTLAGLAGNDYIQGGFGNDTLDGGDGDATSREAVNRHPARGSNSDEPLAAPAQTR